jgi:hypothetical protein
MDDVQLSPVFRQMVESGGWACVEANWSGPTRMERIEKDGVVLHRFQEVGGVDRKFDGTSNALRRADNGLTSVPSFKESFADLGFRYENADEDFLTIASSLSAFKSYLSDDTYLLRRLREKERRLEKVIEDPPASRLLNRGLSVEFHQQMERVVEVNQRKAAQELSRCAEAIESLSRNSK